VRSADTTTPTTEQRYSRSSRRCASNSERQEDQAGGRPRRRSRIASSWMWWGFLDLATELGEDLVPDLVPVAGLASSSSPGTIPKNLDRLRSRSARLVLPSSTVPAGLSPRREDENEQLPQKPACQRPRLTNRMCARQSLGEEDDHESMS